MVPMGGASESSRAGTYLQRGLPVGGGLRIGRGHPRQAEEPGNAAALYYRTHALLGE
jgi:hypothetical protein